MVKSLNEMASSLKEAMVKFAEQNHSGAAFNAHRYNNLKITMEMETEIIPNVVINIAMSEAMFSIKDTEKLGGSLGPDERYALRWLGRTTTLEALREIWNEKMRTGKTKKDNEE